ncbi:MAG: LysM peptidoglycan-binding domain-containing protein [Demequina sp.]
MTAYAITAPGMTGVSGPTRLFGTTAASGVNARRVVRVRPLPTRAGRARRVTLVLLAILIVALLAPRAFAGTDSSEVIAFDTYTVAQGESLWSIAAAITGPGEDVRETISQLQTLNAMGDSSLRAGEQIYIPALER